MSIGFRALPACLAMAWSCHGATISGDDFNANAATAGAAMQQWYNSSGLWDTTGWWNAANCVEAIENVVSAENGGSYLTVISNTFALNSGGNFLNGYYDDEGWWADAWIRAYDLTGDARYLNMAKTIFSDLVGGWDAGSCGGGVWWDKIHSYKNAIPNELFLLVAIRLHQRTPGDGGAGSYFYWATNEWAWFKASGMINAQSLINDGLTSNCQNNGQTTWTYNQGVILGGLTDLYKVTGDSNYLLQAEAIADAAVAHLTSAAGVLQEPCETQGGCGGGDVPEFKGIFVRNLAYLYDEDHKSSYFNFLFKNAHAVWFQDRSSSNQLGLKWTGPFDSADGARQSSALFAISALAEPSTALLPFARGSGDLGFNHTVGAATGTLAWTCGPNTAAGFMQYGPYLASLPVGNHVVHFRMAVDAVSNSTANLVSLAVTQNATSLTSRYVPWNAFARAGEAQDFSVPFTNTVSGGPLEFRVFWNQVTNAPALTLSDVTVDGAHNWTAANLAHDLGRLDGLNAWEADPVRDQTSGYLVKGPGTAELASGAYRANFELKVDNFNRDDATVALLSVVDLDSNQVLASRTVGRAEFPDTLYRDFALNFAAVAGDRYDFRTFWYYSSNAPRLTQRSVVVKPAGAAAFAPISLMASSYNQDMVVERTAPSSPSGNYTTASMDAGTGNTANGWYEQGYNAAAPTTGLPPAGSTLTPQSISGYSYTLAPSYTANNAAMVDATHDANLALAAPADFSSLSFLTAAGHGPVTVDYAVQHADGTAETGSFVSPDWFSHSPVVWNAQGRVDVGTGAFNNVNNNNPRLYSVDVDLSDTTNPVTHINLSWDRSNPGGVAAIFAVSGLAPLVLPYNLVISPLAQTNFAGTAASFSLNAEGTTPFTYQWNKNGSPIPGATDSALDLSNLSTNDTADYSCVVSNLAGAALSGNAALSVIPLPVLDLSRSNDSLTLVWSGGGSLLEATNIAGPWITNLSARSPFPITPEGPGRFYRVLVQ